MALSDNLLAYYAMDEASGDAIDSVAAANLTDNSTVQAVTGKVSGARSFDGSAEYFNRTANLLNGQSAYSIALWLQLTRISNAFRQDAIFYTYDNAVGDGTAIVLDGAALGAKLTFFKRISYGTATAVADAAISLSTWLFVAGTVAADDATPTGGLITLYVNAVAQATMGTKTGTLSNTNDTVVGTDVSGGNYWQGYADELGLWGRELTSAEVTELYNGGSGRNYAYITGGGGGPLPRPGTFVRQAVNRASTY